VFGLVDYLVTERTRELGVRIALGSPRGRVFWLMFRQGCGLVGTGLGIGLVLAYFSRRLIESQVYGVTAADPPTILGAAIVLGGCALAACLGPARRAAKVDPARILKGA
jgi:ABC-type antimicrobial peptide transport system permease subunit